MHQFRYILLVFRGYSLNLVVILLLDFNGIYRAFKGFGHTYLHAFSNFYRLLTSFGLLRRISSPRTKLLAASDA
jgi:hypothetical protein